MKLDTKSGTVTTNMPQAERIAMRISVKGMPHLMHTLSNLYNDPLTAVIREYSANALDSHIMAGQTKPIDVYLPSPYNPVFVVRDYGLGMSKQIIEDVYTVYGESTKQLSNEETGAFGLGCKAAFAISPQFTVVSIHDGLKFTVLFQKEEDGSYDAQIASTLPTTEENGVTVSVPVKSHEVRNFAEKAEKFFRYGDVSKINVNGHPPRSIFEDYTEIELPVNFFDTFVDSCGNYSDPVPSGIAQTYVANEGDYSSESHLVMGNIPYLISNSEMESSLVRIHATVDRYAFLRYPKKFVVPIGAFDLTPNREGLRYTAKTNALIDALFKAMIANMEKTAQTEIDAVDFRHDVYPVADKWEPMLGKKFKWRGETIQRSHIVDNKGSSEIPKIFRDAEYATSSHGILSKFVYKKSHVYKVVYGLPADEYKKASRYLSPYLRSKDEGSGTFYFYEEADKITDPWFIESGNIELIKYDDLLTTARAQMKIDAAERKKLAPKVPKPKVKMKYPVLNLDSKTVTWTEYDVIPSDAVYISSSELQRDSETARKFVAAYSTDMDTRSKSLLIGYFIQHVSAATDSKNIVILAGARTIDTFSKRVPNVKPLFDDLKKKITDSKSLITDDVRKAHAMSRLYYARVLKSLLEKTDTSVIKDPQVHEILGTNGVHKQILGLKDAVSYFDYNVRLASEWDMTYHEKVNDLEGRYKLLQYFGVYSSAFDAKTGAQFVTYMNVVYDDLQSSTSNATINPKDKEDN